MKISVPELCGAIKQDYRILGSKDRYASLFLPIDKAQKEAISFCNNKKTIPLIIERSKASIIICCNLLWFKKKDCQNKTLILVKNPRLAFIRVMQKFCKNEQWSYLERNIFITGNVEIGKNVLIQAGTVIGEDGFGYEKDECGQFIKFPHIGNVIIEDNVEIGSNVCIDRGTLSDTIIGQGTKINNLCHIAHNAVIGKNCLIMAQVYIGGSAKIGDNCHIAPGAIIRNKITIGNNVTVGMGSVVTKYVGDNCTIMGIPAKIVSKA